MAIDWPVPAEPAAPVGATTRRHLVEAVSTWSGLAAVETGSAVDALTLTGEGITLERFPYWKLEQRATRLATRPIISPSAPASPGEIWLLPRAAHQTRLLWSNYLNDGRVPLPKAQLGKALKKSTQAWRRLSEEAFEQEVTRVAREGGLKVRPGLTIEKATGVPLVGEVDLLAGDIRNRRIYVVEAKNLEHPFSPPEIAFNAVELQGPGVLDLRLTSFRPEQLKSRRPAPVEKLLQNAAAVRAHLDDALHLLGVGAQGQCGASESWAVVPVVVTTGVEAAAFVREPRVPFMSLETFEHVLQTCSTPTPGWWDEA
jgi:hypothetical protein